MAFGYACHGHRRFGIAPERRRCLHQMRSVVRDGCWMTLSSTAITDGDRLTHQLTGARTQKLRQPQGDSCGRKPRTVDLPRVCGGGVEEVIALRALNPPCQRSPVADQPATQWKSAVCSVRCRVASSDRATVTGSRTAPTLISSTGLAGTIGRLDGPPKRGNPSTLL